MPIRARLTAAFALAMVLVLAGAALFVYLRLRTDLDETIDDGLRARVAAPIQRAPGDPEDSFAQMVDSDGRVLASEDGSRRPVLTSAELDRTREGTLVLERDVPGIDGTARVRAQAASGGGGVAVAGRSLADRDETLRGLLASFAIGGPVAVLLASLAGYGLATIGLAPIEAMRRRARDVSLEREGDRLPLPHARDEVRRLGETLNEMLDRLRRSFERERRFVADASHELRTPIAVIKTELETALRSNEVGPSAHESLVAAVEECDRLVQLAEDLLVIARAGEGQLPVRAESLVARHELEGARQRFGDRAEARGRPIRLDADDAVAIHADPLRLRQVLGNLVDNALRHGEGEVVLGARREEGGGWPYRSAIPARASLPTGPHAPSSALRGVTRRAAAPARDWALRSCARWPRPTAAAPRSSLKRHLRSWCGSPTLQMGWIALRLVSATGSTVLISLHPPLEDTNE